MELWKAGLFVGAMGDIGLQLADKLGVGNKGLEEYFRKQGNPVVSVLKASLLTSFWSGAYAFLSPLPSLLGFAVFAGGVDVLYRFAHPWLYPTLGSYYRENGPVETVLFNSVTAGLVWGFSKLV